MSSGGALDVQWNDKSGADSRNLVIEKARSNSDTQRWRLVDVDGWNGIYKIVNRKCAWSAGTDDTAYLYENNGNPTVVGQTYQNARNRSLSYAGDLGCKNF